MPWKMLVPLPSSFGCQKLNRRRACFQLANLTGSSSIAFWGTRPERLIQRHLQKVYGRIKPPPDTIAIFPSRRFATPPAAVSSLSPCRIDSTIQVRVKVTIPCGIRDGAGCWPLLNSEYFRSTYRIRPAPPPMSPDSRAEPIR